MGISSRKALAYSVAALFTVLSAAVAQSGLSDPNDRVIRYGDSEDLTDPVALLQQQLTRGEAKLEFEPSHGYLNSLLRLLNVPTSSQTLVFSKTSFQRQRINSQTPRALYFNDNVYVGWVPGGDIIEISDVDPKKGAIFYSLDQSLKQPRFERRGECMQCHLTSKTLGVPGHMLRSVITGPDGYPLSQVRGFVIGHNTPLSERWGGWYVTGTAANDVHLGNPSLLFDTSRYLSPHSDIVALMVLAHQVRMHNLITRANYETRYALDQQTAFQKTDWTKQRIVNVGEPLLEYMLFRDEVPLKGQISGTSGFAEDFQRIGPRDSKGRSLRDLDLRTRMFRYPCSFLIYSDAFDQLPEEIRQYLWRRLSEILTGHDQSPTYAAMARADREAVLGILRETKPAFAEFLKRQSVTTADSRLPR